MAEAVIVEYEPLPVVDGVETALAESAPVIHAGMEDNIVFYREFGGGDVERAFRQADLTLDKTFNFPRQTAVPIETRGVVAHYDRGEERLSVWTSCRSPHLVRTTISNVMRLPQHAVRVISQDVGGEFGIKGAAYPESIILGFLSRKIDRPVKWVEDRMENLLACGHAHEMVIEVSVAAANNGRILGIDAKVLVDQGAHTLGPTSARLEPMTAGQSIVGPYRIDNFRCNSYGVLTNKCPGAAYRGVGTVQGVFVIERVMDIIAAKLGLDPADVRMKNFIQPEDQPFNTSAGRLYDSGDYPETLAKLLEVSEYEKMRAAQAEARERGELAGIGICCFVEHSSTGSQDYHKRGVYGLPAFDSATVKVDAGGNIMVAVSAKSTGQSHDSVFALLVARELGVPYETVKILGGRHRRGALRVGYGSQPQRREHGRRHPAGGARREEQGDRDRPFLHGGGSGRAGDFRGEDIRHRGPVPQRRVRRSSRRGPRRIADRLAAEKHRAGGCRQHALSTRHTRPSATARTWPLSASIGRRGW